MGKKTQAGIQHLFYQLFIIALAPLLPTSQIPHPVTVIYSLGVVAVLSHAQNAKLKFVMNEMRKK